MLNSTEFKIYPAHKSSFISRINTLPLVFFCTSQIRLGNALEIQEYALLPNKLKQISKESMQSDWLTQLLKIHESIIAFIRVFNVIQNVRVHNALEMPTKRFVIRIREQ